MPLSNLQTVVLRLLAGNRNPESYVAGSTPLNRNSTRYSGDIDIFHDREERLGVIAKADATVLESAGYAVSWLRQEPAIYTAAVAGSEGTTRLEWVADSDYRFFPTIPDALFGYVIHPIDLALNKTSAAAGRRELRDIIDLLRIHERVLPLGAAVWAAVDKSPGYSPEALITEIRRNLQHSHSEWRDLPSEEPIDPVSVLECLRTALSEAEAFVNKMPTDKAGLLFLKDGKVVQPDPARLDEYQTHAGQRRGHWPTNREIDSAMLERYGI